MDVGNVAEPWDLSESLRQWAHDRNRESIWVEDTHRKTVLGTSKEFRRVFRPIFLKAYDVLYLKQKLHGSYANVEIPQTGLASVHPPLTPPPGGVTTKNIKADIEHLVDVVRYVTKLQPPSWNTHDVPIVLKKFNEFHETARICNSKADMRYWIYFITKNPMIFTATESLAFAEKTWNLRNLHITNFEATVNHLSPLPGFIHRIDATMKELYYIRTDYQRRKRPDPFVDPCRSIDFVQNTRRHFQEVPYGGKDRNVDPRNATLLVIYEKLAEQLYDIIPVFFNAMACGYYHVPWRFPLGGNRDFFIELLEDEPDIISPDDVC